MSRCPQFRGALIERGSTIFPNKLYMYSVAQHHGVDTLTCLEGTGWVAGIEGCTILGAALVPNPRDSRSAHVPTAEQHQPLTVSLFEHSTKYDHNKQNTYACTLYTNTNGTSSLQMCTFYMYMCYRVHIKNTEMNTKNTSLYKR